MTGNRVSRQDYELAMLLDIVCHGRPYSPKEVWSWLEEDDIECLRSGEMTVFIIMQELDSLQQRGEKLVPSGHQIELPATEVPVQKKESQVRPPNLKYSEGYSAGPDEITPLF
jgi:hypothetical protein